MDRFTVILTSSIFLSLVALYSFIYLPFQPLLFTAIFAVINFFVLFLITDPDVLVKVSMLLAILFSMMMMYFFLENFNEA